MKNETKIIELKKTVISLRDKPIDTTGEVYESALSELKDRLSESEYKSFTDSIVTTKSLKEMLKCN